MRKLLLGLMGVLFLVGCSSDSDNNGGGSGEKVLIKRITQTYHDPDGDFSETTISDFTYDNGKLIRTGSAQNYTDYIYSGDKVTATKSYYDGSLYFENEILYNGGRISQIVSDDGSRTVISYSGSNVSHVQMQTLSEGAWVTTGTQTYQFSNGNVSAWTVEYEDDGIFGGDYRYTFTTDSKNNPFRDMDDLTRLFYPTDGILPMSRNNATTASYFTPADSNSPETVYTYEIEYNSANFPVSVKMKRPDGALMSESYFEYM